MRIDKARRAAESRPMCVGFKSIGIFDISMACRCFIGVCCNCFTEPCRLLPSIIRINLRNQANMIKKIKVNINECGSFCSTRICSREAKHVAEFWFSPRANKYAWRKTRLWFYHLEYLGSSGNQECNIVSYWSFILFYFCRKILTGEILTQGKSLIRIFFSS